jgi:hypothetical protein
MQPFSRPFGTEPIPANFPALKRRAFPERPFGTGVVHKSFTTLAAAMLALAAGASPGAVGIGRAGCSGFVPLRLGLE